MIAKISSLAMRLPSSAFRGGIFQINRINRDKMDQASY